MHICLYMLGDVALQYSEKERTGDCTERLALGRTVGFGERCWTLDWLENQYFGWQNYRILSGRDEKENETIRGAN